MGSGYSKRKKQAKMMQEQFSQIQEKMAEIEVTGQAGNGLVTITLNGENALKSIKIKPECVDADDIEGLEDLIKAAYDEAHQKVLKETTQGLPTGGMPGLGGFGGFG